jgi:hypothetical protein
VGLERSSVGVITAMLLSVLLGIYAVLAFPQNGPPPMRGMGMLGVIVHSEQVHQALGLNSTQEARWLQLKQDADAVFNQMETAHQALRTLIDSEFAKDRADLAAIETAMEARRSADDTALKALHLEALDFYSILTVDQQDVVITALKRHQQIMDMQSSASM